jgi:hypothetical protein
VRTQHRKPLRPFAAIRKCHAGRLEYLRIYVAIRDAVERYNLTMNESLFDEVRQLSVEADLDFLLTEIHVGEPAALVEYKH